MTLQAIIYADGSGNIVATTTCSPDQVSKQSNPFYSAAVTTPAASLPADYTTSTANTTAMGGSGHIYKVSSGSLVKASLA